MVSFDFLPCIGFPFPKFAFLIGIDSAIAVVLQGHTFGHVSANDVNFFLIDGVELVE